VERGIEIVEEALERRRLAIEALSPDT